MSKLYDALETGKLTLDDLSARIKQLKVRQDELAKAGVQVEADMVVKGVRHVEVEAVKSYARDLCMLLENVDFVQSKAFLRSFVKKIIINGKMAIIQYHFPIRRMGRERRRQEFCLQDMLVELRGVEPLTYSMPLNRSPS